MLAAHSKDAVHWVLLLFNKKIYQKAANAAHQALFICYVFRKL